MSNRSLYFPPLKRRATYSAFRRYNQYRQEIREDCQGRCVYCDAHENELGGIEFMTLDHFKPKDLYRHLMHKPMNLLWTCMKCNHSKGNLWPAFGTPHNVINGNGFIDPFEVDYNDYFEVLPGGQLKPLQHPATYMINNLSLNRTGAMRIREKRRLNYENKQRYEIFVKKAIAKFDSLIADPSLADEQREKLLQQKKDFEQESQFVIMNLQQDFSLH